jgi:hypothetical protein
MNKRKRKRPATEGCDSNSNSCSSSGLIGAPAALSRNVREPPLPQEPLPAGLQLDFHIFHNPEEQDTFWESTYKVIERAPQTPGAKLEALVKHLQKRGEALGKPADAMTLLWTLRHELSTLTSDEKRARFKEIRIITVANTLVVLDNGAWVDLSSAITYGPERSARSARSASGTFHQHQLQDLVHEDKINAAHVTGSTHVNLQVFPSVNRKLGKNGGVKKEYRKMNVKGAGKRAAENHKFVRCLIGATIYCLRQEGAPAEMLLLRCASAAHVLGLKPGELRVVSLCEKLRMRPVLATGASHPEHLMRLSNAKNKECFRMAYQLSQQGLMLSSQILDWVDRASDHSLTISDKAQAACADFMEKEFEQLSHTAADAEAVLSAVMRQGRSKGGKKSAIPSPTFCPLSSL